MNPAEQKANGSPNGSTTDSLSKETYWHDERGRSRVVSGPAFFVVGRRVVIFAKVWQKNTDLNFLLLVPLRPFFQLGKAYCHRRFIINRYWYCYEGGEFHGSIGGGCGTDQS